MTSRKHRHNHGQSNNVVISGGNHNSDKVNSGNFLSAVSSGEDNSNLLVVPDLSSKTNKSMNSLQNLVNGTVPGKRDNSRSGAIDKTGQEELQNKNEEPQMSYVWQKTKWTKVCIGSFQECK